jgi:hypothetical protein
MTSVPLLRLIQFLDASGQRRVGCVDASSGTVRELSRWHSTYELARAAIEARVSLAALARPASDAPAHSFDTLLAEQRVLLPLDHPDPAHCIVTGTGLTHLGSAQTRDAMHAKIAGAETALTDSMKIFRWGVERGKPADGSAPVQPEWFYKGDGSWLVPPGAPLVRPSFAEDGGEEAELVGLYVNGDDGGVHRVGFALGNEFSDHVMERKNYLYLAHSKLRSSSFGPELLVGDLPPAIEGRARLLRGTTELWSGTFHTGEENMSYRLAGLEHHHFKYPQFRRPGDVHCHYFGTSLLSFASGISAEAGDVFELSAPPFSRPLRNSIAFQSTAAPCISRL